jgi:hypothetical protein
MQANTNARPAACAALVIRQIRRRPPRGEESPEAGCPCPGEARGEGGADGATPARRESGDAADRPRCRRWVVLRFDSLSISLSYDHDEDEHGFRFRTRRIYVTYPVVLSPTRAHVPRRERRGVLTFLHVVQYQASHLGSSLGSTMYQ